MEYFDVREYDLAGRIGRIKTRHGVIETPYVFPVIDPVRQDVDLKTVYEIGFNAIITNAYLYYKRNKGIARDLHSELGWNHTIMTDSGGYQVLVYGDVEVDNKTIVKYQKSIGSDIAVILDIPTGTKMSWEEAYNAVEETWRRALEALPLIMDSDQLWTLPIQGSPYFDLLKKSAIRAWKVPYHIYAFGSPTVLLERYEYSSLLELVSVAKRLLPPGRPLHVFGVGHPMILPFLVALGADLFDSASYILYAREGRYMLPEGTKRVNELTYLPCNCPVCSRYSVRELLELPSEERVRLIAIHNLYMLKKEINTIKESIREGRLWELLEERSRAHPSLRRAFEVVKKNLDYIRRYNPVSKPDIPAIFLIDSESYFNPRLREVEERSLDALNYILEKKDNVVIFIVSDKSFIDLKNKIRNSDRGRAVLIVHPVLGVFPIELANTYPYFQHEEGLIDSIRDEVLEDIASKISKILDNKSVKSVDLIIYGDPSKLKNAIAEKIKHVLKQRVSKIETRNITGHENSFII
ncbi:tRNA guanosine(15) transglycosylase TgtA [Thermogladius sp. 4427co]|uniref:tRNA guanosine(15) transglycosylase TgtA n=1 Tax=Thermogladius sp. 4427co TaxID=3450718 RepID=UPI003F7A5C6D